MLELLHAGNYEKIFNGAFAKCVLGLYDENNSGKLNIFKRNAIAEIQHSWSVNQVTSTKKAYVLLL